MVCYSIESRQGIHTSIEPLFSGQLLESRWTKWPLVASSASVSALEGSYRYCKSVCVKCRERFV